MSAEHNIFPRLPYLERRGSAASEDRDDACD